MDGIIVKLTQDRVTGEKETNLNCVYEGLMEMGSKKWPKQVAFTLFTKERLNLWEIDKKKKIRLWVFS